MLGGMTVMTDQLTGIVRVLCFMIETLQGKHDIDKMIKENDAKNADAVLKNISKATNVVPEGTGKTNVKKLD